MSNDYCSFTDKWRSSGSAKGVINVDVDGPYNCILFGFLAGQQPATLRRGYEAILFSRVLWFCSNGNARTKYILPTKTIGTGPY